MLKDLINPTNFNVLVGKLGDVLVKALDQPLGYAINWGRIWSLWPVHLETACCSVEFGATFWTKVQRRKVRYYRSFRLFTTMRFGCRSGNCH